MACNVQSRGVKGFYSKPKVPRKTSAKAKVKPRSLE